MYILALLLPLLSAILIFSFGRRFGAYGSALIACVNMGLLLFVSCWMLHSTLSGSVVLLDLWNWLAVGSQDLFFTISFDSSSATMFMVVSLVSGCVHLYSTVYMYTDPFFSRFVAYLSFFTFFMLLLVSAGNLLVFFLGWEGVGLCSYLLISFWYTRAQAIKAATKAFLVNKVGDLFLLSGVSVAMTIFYTVDFGAIGTLVAFIPTPMAETICALLFIGVIGKSAQIGLHTWLPDAMEGPTPVSALIHAATMVTAGIFLIVRCSAVFENAPTVSFFIAILGALTSLISGTIGIAQNDIKKIIAYSTCSQLGYMAAGAGISMYDVGLFHLFNHSFFKALLFLSAGSIIHIMSNEQDIRRMGGLAPANPFIYISMVVASLALAGFPFLSGFYSKDLIIEVGYAKMWTNSSVFYWFLISAAVLTAMYSFRLLEQVFLEDFKGFKYVISNRPALTNIELIVLGVLSVLSVFSGYLFKDIYTSFGSGFFSSVRSYGLWDLVEVEGLSYVIKILPLFLLIISFDIKLWLFECKWFYNEFVNFNIAIPLTIYGRHIFEQLEKFGLESLGPMFFYTQFRNTLYSK